MPTTTVHTKVPQSELPAKFEQICSCGYEFICYGNTMSYQTTEERIDHLDAALGKFITESLWLNQQAEKRLAALQSEMRAFKDEMRAFKTEMLEFKDEMRAFKDESVRDRQEIRRQMGDLSKKLGTIVEDILSPNLWRLARQYFGFEGRDLFTRFRRRQGADSIECDALLVGEHHLLWAEARSTPRFEQVAEFINLWPKFEVFFPEYNHLKKFYLLGSWSIPENVVAELTKHGIYALQMGEETMELVNIDEITNKIYPTIN